VILEIFFVDLRLNARPAQRPRARSAYPSSAHLGQTLGLIDATGIAGLVRAFVAEPGVFSPVPCAAKDKSTASHRHKPGEFQKVCHRHRPMIYCLAAVTAAAGGGLAAADDG